MTLECAKKHAQWKLKSAPLNKKLERFYSKSLLTM